MYARRFYRQSPPPGYAGNAFAREEAVPEEKETPPIPVPMKQSGQAAARQELSAEKKPPYRAPLQKQAAFSPRELRPSAARGFEVQDGYTSRERDADFLLDAYRERQKASLAPLAANPFGSDDSDEALALKEEGLPAVPVFLEPKSETKKKTEGRQAPSSGECGDGFLKKLIRSRFSLEDLLLIAVALLLASGEADDEVLLLLGLLLVLMGK